MKTCKYLTAQIVADAAAQLPYWGFMCPTVQQVALDHYTALGDPSPASSARAARNEFSKILLSLGVVNHKLDAMVTIPGIDHRTLSDAEYQYQRAGIRIMFLEFLSYQLEDAE